MKKVTRPELNSNNFVTATDVRNRKIVRTVAVNGFQVGINDSEYKPGLRVWGGVDLPVDVPPEDKENKLYTQRGATGHGVITYDDIPIGGVSSDFLRKQFTEQLDTNECRGDIVRYIVGSDEKLKKAFAHHYAPNGRWKVSRANHLASSPRANSVRRALKDGEEDYEEGQGVLCLSFGESPQKDGMLLRGFARLTPALIHNIPNNVKAKAVYLSADEPGHLDFEPTTVRVGVAIDRADNNKGDVLIYFDHVGAGVQGEKGEKGDKGDPIIFDLSANRNFFEMKNGSYTNLGNIKLKVRRNNIIGTDGDVVKWYVKKATGSFQLVTNDDFITIDTTDSGHNKSTMSSSQFDSLRDGDTFVTVKAVITDSVDGQVYEDEEDIHLMVINDGKDGKDGKDAKKFDLKLSRNSFYMDPNGRVNDAWPANTPIELKVDIDNIIPSPEIQWEVKKQGGAYQIVSPIDVLLNFVSPSPYLATSMDVNQFNAIRDNTEVIVVRASTVDQDGIAHSEEREINLVVNGKNNKDFDLDADGEVFVMDADGNLSSANPSNSIITFEVTRNNIVGVPDKVIWYVAKNGASPSLVIGVDKLTVDPADSNIATMTAEQFDLIREDQATVVVTASILDTLSAPSTPYSDNKRVRLIRETKSKANRTATLHANPMRFIRGSDGSISSSDSRNIEIDFHHNISGFDYSNVASVTWSYRLSSSSPTSWVTVANNNVLTRINSLAPLDLNKALQATMAAAQFVNAVGTSYDSLIIRTQITDDEGQTYTNQVTIDQTIETKGGDAVNPRLVDLRANPLRFIRNSAGIIDSSDSRNINVEFKHSLTNLNYVNVQTVKWQYRLSNNLNWIDVTNNDAVTRINSVESSNLDKALEASMSTVQFANLVGSNVLSVIVRTIVTDENVVDYINEVTIDQTIETKGESYKTAALTANPLVFNRNADGDITSADSRNINVFFKHNLTNFTYTNVSSVVWHYRRTDSSNFITVNDSNVLTRINSIDGVVGKALEASMTAEQFASVVGSGNYSVVVQTTVTETSGETYTNEVTINLSNDGSDGGTTNAPPVKNLELKADSNQFKNLVDGTFVPDIINFEIQRSNLVGTVVWFTNGNVANSGTITLSADANSATMSPAQFQAAGGSINNPVKVVVELDGLDDAETIFLIEDGKTIIEESKDLRLTSSHLFFRTNSDDVTSPNHIEFNATKISITSTLVWKVNDVAITSSTLTLQNETQAMMDFAQFVAAGGSISNSVKVSVEADGIVRFVNIGLIVDVKPPEVTKTFLLTVKPENFHAKYDGTVEETDSRNLRDRKLQIRHTGLSLDSVQWLVKKGSSTSYQSAGSNITTVTNSLLAGLNAAQFNAIRAGEEFINVKAIGYEGASPFEDEVTVSLIKDGPPKLLKLNVDTPFITYKNNGTYEPNGFNFNVQLQVVEAANLIWYVNGNPYNPTNDKKLNILAGNINATMSPAQFEEQNSARASINVKVRSDIDDLEDSVTVTMLVEKPIIRSFDLTVSRSTFTADSNDFVDPLIPSNSTINFQVVRDGFESTTPVVWQLEVGGVFVDITTQYTYPLSSPFLNANMSAEQFNAIRGSDEVVRIKAVSVEGGTTYERAAEISLIKMPSKEIERNYGNISLIASRYTFHKRISGYEPSTDIRFEVVRDEGVSPFPFINWGVKSGTATSYTVALASDNTNLSISNDISSNPGYNFSTMSTTQFESLSSGEDSVFVRADLVVPNTNMYDPNVDFYDIINSNNPITRNTAITSTYFGSKNVVCWLRPRSGNKPLNSVKSSNSYYVSELSYFKPQTRVQNINFYSQQYPAFPMENGNAIIAHSNIFNFTDNDSDKPFSISFLLRVPSTNEEFRNKVLLVKNRGDFCSVSTDNKFQYALTTASSANQIIFTLIGQDGNSSLSFTLNALFTLNAIYYLTISYDPSASATSSISFYRNTSNLSKTAATNGTWTKMHYDATQPSFMVIGCNGDSYTQAMEGGLISEILIHNKNLKQSEHSTLYYGVYYNSCNEYYTRNVEITRTVTRLIDMEPEQNTFVKNQFDEYHPESQVKSFRLYKYNIEDSIQWFVNDSTANVGSKVTITTNPIYDTITVNEQQFENNKDSNDLMTIKATVNSYGLQASAVLNMIRQEFKMAPEIILGVAAGFDHALVLTNKNLYAWGSNQFGQLGVADNQGSSTPILEPKIVNFGSSSVVITKISAGQHYSAVIDQDGNLWTWGSHANYRTGRNTSAGFSYVPTKIETTLAYSTTGAATTETGKRFKYLSCGPDFAVAVGTDYKLYCWGSNRYGKCGVSAYNSFNIAINSNIGRPRRIQSDSDSRNFNQISAGSEHAMALSSEGIAYSWGSNENYRTGIVKDTDYYEKATVSGNEIIVQKLGNLLDDNGYKTFTYNGTTYNQNYENHFLKPIKKWNGSGKEPIDLNAVKKISAGYKHSLLSNVESNGEAALYGFGDGSKFQLKVVTFGNVPPIRIDKFVEQNSPGYLGFLIYGFNAYDAVLPNNFDARYYNFSIEYNLYAGHDISCYDGQFSSKLYLKTSGIKSERFDGTTNPAPGLIIARNNDNYFQSFDDGYFAFLTGANFLSTSKGLDDDYQPYTLIAKNLNFLWSFGYNQKGAAGHPDLVDNYIVGLKRVLLLDRRLGIENSEDAYMKLQQLLL